MFLKGLFVFSKTVKVYNPVSTAVSTIVLDQDIRLCCCRTVLLSIYSYFENENNRYMLYDLISCIVVL
jgi:hypothetical protein